MRRLPLNRLGAGQKKSGQNIPKNRLRTTIAERMVETRAELPFIGDQIVCLSHDQAARSADCVDPAPPCRQKARSEPPSPPADRTEPLRRIGASEAGWDHS